MSFIEYCQQQNLTIRHLSEESIEALAANFLENVTITQSDIDELASLENGKCSIDDAIAADLQQAKQVA
jgi:hypothetical protein